MDVVFKNKERKKDVDERLNFGENVWKRNYFSFSNLKF